MGDLLSQQSLMIIELRWPSIHKELLTHFNKELNCTYDTNTLIINDIQLTSNYDRLAETQLHMTRIPQSAQVTFIYGPGLGDNCRALLKRKELKKLHVILLNAEVFSYVLAALDQSCWLKDPRTELHFIDHIEEVYSPFIASPSELMLAQSACRQLSDRVALELNHAFIQQRHIQEKNIKIKNLNFLEQDPGIADLPPVNEKNIYIAAAGPTLETHLYWLQTQKPFLIAVDAAVNILLSKGITPDIVVSIDRKSRHLFTLEDLHALSAVPLVYFPEVDSQLLQDWRGPRFSSYSDTKRYEDIPKHLSRITLYSAGSVIHPTIDLAVKLHASAIYLLGADFSFALDKSHATPSSAIKLQQSIENATHWLFNSLDQKVPTLANLKGYLRDLERYISKHKDITFYNGSKQGAKIAGTTLWKK